MTAAFGGEFGLNSPAKLVALNAGMFYDAVTQIHYGLEASASGRDPESKGLSQDGMPRYGKLRAGEVWSGGGMGQCGAGQQGSRPDGG